jgi:putative aminopeptidase FrvX
VGLLSMRDAENCIRLVIELVKKLDKKTVAGLTEV